MGISNELFLAILSMDAYNHGYGSGLGDTEEDADADGLGGLGTKVGWAAIAMEAGSEEAQDAGFYALAYDWNGQTVVSYRGTSADTEVNFLTDALNGYFVGGGSPENDRCQVLPNSHRNFNVRSEIRAGNFNGTFTWRRPGGVHRCNIRPASHHLR